MHKFASWIFLIFFSTNVCASIKEYSGKDLHLKFGVDIPGYDLEFRGDNQSVRFRPNLMGLFSVGASLQGFLGVNWGFRTSQSQEEHEQKGHTEYNDYRLNLAFEQFHIFLQYGQYRGFYAEESGPLISGWNEGDPYYQADQLTARTAAVNFTWVLSPGDFSLIAAMDQTARQTSSGGSWLIGASVMETVFKDDREIIPVNVQGGFGDDAELKEGRFLAFSAKGGYGYTITFTEKIFASLAVQGGVGTQRMTLMGTGFDRSKWAPATKAEGLFAAGWNGDDHFFGLSGGGDATTFDTGEIKIISGFWSAKIFYGFRL